jgi:hypothetical protein
MITSSKVQACPVHVEAFYLLQMGQMSIDCSSAPNLFSVVLLQESSDFAYISCHASHASLTFTGLVFPGGGGAD